MRSQLMWSCRSSFRILLILLLAGCGPLRAETAASVKLPLPEYLSLVEKVESLERQAQKKIEKIRADVTARTTSITIREAKDPTQSSPVAEIVTTFQVELTGTPTAKLDLPFSGLAEEIVVEPRQGASLDRQAGRVVFYAPHPGSYTVTVRGHGSLQPRAGGHRLTLVASSAPVSSLEIELPMDREWTCEGAVLVSDELVSEDSGERRRVRLAPTRGREHVLEIRREYGGEEQEKALIRSSVVSVLEVAHGGARGAGTVNRRDVVFHEVLRGELGTFVLTLPTGLDLDRIATDEGEAFPIVDGPRLTVERRHRLSAKGHLILAYRPWPLSSAALPLAAPELPEPPRARYLVTASAVAAKMRPMPESSWQRIDLEDLPEDLAAGIRGLRPNAVWKFAGKAVETHLEASPLPEVQNVGGVVWERKTTTLLTVDGSLVHRDRLVVEGMGTALELILGPGATLWSAQVDDVAVRPLEGSADPSLGKTMIVPLAFQSEGRAIVELVTVEERRLEPGRSRARIESLQVGQPVVHHEWQLLLPENNRYRLVSSQLEAVGEVARQAGRASAAIPSARDPWQVLQKVKGVQSDGINVGSNESEYGMTSILGTVTDTDGGVLPGVTMSLKSRQTASMQTTISDARGRFGFRGMAAGAYKLKAALDGFSTVEYPDVQVYVRRTTEVEVALTPAIEEAITVLAESPLLDSRKAARRRAEIENEQAREVTKYAFGAFEDGLASGVKPLQVEIPESGKLLLLSGALPPSRVTVELDVKAK